MGGKSKSTTVGYWYKVLYHAGLCVGEFDAFLEFRGGDKTAWSGELQASGTISINAPFLWGGEKDQGGIVGDVDVMFGEATQQPNAYLLANLGPQVPAWRGMGTLVFKGGKYGAMNPYPQKASYKIRRILKCWSDQARWYPETAVIGLSSDGTVFIGGTLFREPLSAYSLVSGSLAAYSLAPNGIVLASTAGSEFAVLERAISSSAGSIKSLSVTFTILSTGDVDQASFSLVTPDGYVLITFNVRRSIDGLKRAAIGYNVGSEVSAYFGTQPLAVGVRYRMDATLAAPSSALTARIINDSTGALFAEVSVAGPGGLIDRLQFRTRGSGSTRFESARWSTFGAPLQAMNPAHVLYYARTHEDMGREPVAAINDESFRAAADVLFVEGFGICAAYDPTNESIEEFEQRICKLIGGSVSRSLVDGQWYLDLARGDYDLTSLPILNDDDILDFSELPSTLDGAINSLSVKYFDPEKKEDIVTPPIQALALIDAFGTIHQVSEYPEVPNAKLATRVGERDLRTTVTPTRAFELTTTRKPNSWRPNQYFRLQSPKRGIADMVCILGEKQSGTLRSGAIKIKATQDIYGLPSTSFVEVEPGVDTSPSVIPQPITLQRVYEAPYVQVAQALSRADLAALPDDVGYLQSVAADPATSRDYSLMVEPAGSAYAVVASGEWCPTAVVTEAASHLDTSFTLAGGVGLDQVEVGSAALWDDEIVRVDALDATTGVITLGRGCSDTPPVPHIGEGRIWFFDAAAASDVTEYTSGESVNVKLLANTGTAQLELALATEVTVTFAGRQALPYAPGALAINEEPYPAIAYESMEITWAHRDRVAQVDQLVDTGMASIGPEPGVTYTIRVYNVATETLVDEQAGIAGASAISAPPADATVRVEVWAVRGDLESWMPHSHTLEWRVSALADYVDDAGDNYVDETGNLYQG